MTTKSQIPDDDNGGVLGQMLESGDDLVRSRDTIAQAAPFASEAAALADLEVDLAAPNDDPDSEVRVVRHMVPTQAGITDLESQLDAMAQSHGGPADGWGCGQVDRLH